MRRVLITAGLVVALVVAMTSPVHATEPLRAGTILGGYFPFAGVAPGPGPDCTTNADCLPWVATRCPKAMVGFNPGLHSSIVDVRELAMSQEKRTFVVRQIAQDDVNLIWGGVSVQFWSRSCFEVAQIGSYISGGIDDRAKFAIPEDAAWMTVASVDSAPLRWSLR